MVTDQPYLNVCFHCWYFVIWFPSRCLPFRSSWTPTHICNTLPVIFQNCFLFSKQEKSTVGKAKYLLASSFVSLVRLVPDRLSASVPFAILFLYEHRCVKENSLEEECRMDQSANEKKLEVILSTGPRRRINNDLIIYQKTTNSELPPALTRQT